MTTTAAVTIALALLAAAPAQAATTCTAKATWHFTIWGTHATVDVDRTTATGDGCAALLPAAGTSYEQRVGVFSGGSPLVAAFELLRNGATVGGLKVTGGDLDAVVREGGTLAVYDGDGSTCGDGCYRTTGRWASG